MSNRPLLFKGFEEAYSFFRLLVLAHNPQLEIPEFVRKHQLRYNIIIFDYDNPSVVFIHTSHFLSEYKKYPNARFVAMTDEYIQFFLELNPKGPNGYVGSFLLSNGGLYTEYVISDGLEKKITHINSNEIFGYDELVNNLGIDLYNMSDEEYACLKLAVYGQ